MRKVIGYGLRALAAGWALWFLWQWSLNGRYQAVHLADMSVAIVDSRTGTVEVQVVTSADRASVPRIRLHRLIPETD